MVYSSEVVDERAYIAPDDTGFNAPLEAYVGGKGQMSRHV